MAEFSIEVAPSMCLVDRDEPNEERSVSSSDPEVCGLFENSFATCHSSPAYLQKHELGIEDSFASFVELDEVRLFFAKSGDSGSESSTDVMAERPGIVVTEDVERTESGTLLEGETDAEDKNSEHRVDRLSVGQSIKIIPISLSTDARDDGNARFQISIEALQILLSNDRRGDGYATWKLKKLKETKLKIPDVSLYSSKHIVGNVIRAHFGGGIEKPLNSGWTDVDGGDDPQKNDSARSDSETLLGNTISPNAWVREVC
uniref:Uncharacterized protein n=1 Tax=Corethron hystrix TaxID=216773 RepID=A0A7S1BH17_9STRA|mmetsp:Transcript_25988/g.59795  ORF Transcript_25988/g.59795 Transcript_25988/m.59795 type:complete len:259 (+) Transcript_25988:3-779(+)